MPPVCVGPIEGAGVLGAGTAFPALELDNVEALRALGGPIAEDEARLAFLGAGLGESLGVARRAWAHRVGRPLAHGQEETTASLGVSAARAALDDAGLSPADLSMLICVTSTPHRMTSTVSAAIGAALRCQAACMDLRAGCAAGLFALLHAALALRAGAGPVLLVGTETFSKVIPPGSRLAALALGDGAGALVLGRRDGAVIESLYLESDGALGALLSTDGALPPTVDEIERGGYVLSGSPDAFTAAVRERYAIAIRAALARARRSGAEVAAYVPHQTSRALIADVCADAQVPLDRAFIRVERHANVGAAGWLVALSEARAEGRVTEGAPTLIAAVGGGMSWGAAVWRI